MDMHSNLAHGSVTVNLSGEFTFNDHPEFREILNHIATHGVHQVVIDLAKVTFVDSAALGMLLLASDESQKHSKKLIVRHATGQVKKMFDMANFEAIFKLE